MACRSWAICAGLLIGLGTAGTAVAQVAVSANDAKVALVAGQIQVNTNPQPDTLSFIDLRTTPPKVLAEIEAPNSVAGPPSNVAVTPKENLALVASSMRVDPTDPKKLIPDDRVSVIDLMPLKPSLVARVKSVVGVGGKGPPPAPKVVATVQAGKGASGIAINKAGTLALVANRSEGTVSVLTINGNTVTAAGKVTLGGEKSGPSAVAFTPDGKTALVTLDGDNTIKVLSVDGNNVELTKREITAGIRPYGLDVSGKGDVAVVANVGRGGGDIDTISVIDLKSEPPRVVNTYSVGQTPQGIKMSPDGKFVAVTVANGSNKAPGTPFASESGVLQVWMRNGIQLSKASEMPTGKWCQGIAWSSNGKTLLVQCMVEEEITVVRFSGLTGRSLQKVGVIKTKGGPAGIRTAEP